MLTGMGKTGDTHGRLSTITIRTMRRAAARTAKVIIFAEFILNYNSYK